ncbi:DUF6090 family protein [Eudoraea adriatica]|uniref:DUF6090 family protein n=1 Tax=Eudoraea adriatica TaxID=446681 RepID=UPI001969FE7E|nr:DUF6090 family protein [Eudoraea adriatica]
MINFFRRIRKQLADDNKPLKYLRYAVGEIVLVVVGILIALQINNWNQFRSERKLELKILKDLRAEIITNNHKINNAKVRKEVLYKPLAKYMKLMDEGKVEYIDFVEIHKKDFFSGQIKPSFGVINSFISSGDVNLISNDSLKYLLTDWKDHVAVFTAMEFASFNGHRRFSEYFDKRYPNLENQFHNKSSEDLRNRFVKIYNDVEYGNRLITVKEHFESSINYAQNTNVYINGMIKLIDKEIAKLD